MLGLKLECRPGVMFFKEKQGSGFLHNVVVYYSSDSSFLMEHFQRMLSLKKVTIICLKIVPLVLQQTYPMFNLLRAKRRA